MTEPSAHRSAGFTDDEIARLRQLAYYADILKSIAKAHSALILIGQVVKWLAALAGALVMLKGMSLW